MRRRTLYGIKSTRAMRRVLLVLLTDAANIGGHTIIEAVGVGSRAANICLAQLVSRAWVTGEFTDGSPPQRRFYRLTPDGWSYAHQLLGLTPPEGRRG
ncbi:hypothetical protein [Sphaerisporangium aureirubrum]|uniref:MarR family transcriptional regulator n=1 Tax=Sphaerisporangium aureirubrum TaxID=1544736 RepID=A0ABW1NDX2_9ACTN